jgi:sporulation integral membrane protein YtvI
MTHEYLPPQGWKRVLVLAVYILIGAALGYAALRWLLAPALPFLAAWAIAALVQPLAEFLARHTRLSKRLLCVILACGILALIGLIITSLCVFATNGLSGLLSRASSEANAVLADIERFIRSISEKLKLPDNPLFSNGYIHDLGVSFVQNTITAIAARVPEILGRIISTLPGMILFAIVTLIASIYLSADYKKIGAAVASVIPERARGVIAKGARRLVSALVKYLKAYALIALITFTELSIGLIILRVEYAIFVAAVIALADALPVIGAGAALLPWAAISLLRGDYYRGIGLIVVYIVVLVVRQFVEPKVVGNVSGLHPLAALAALYCGFKLFGVAGLFVFPFAAIIAGELFLRREEE